MHFTSITVTPKPEPIQYQQENQRPNVIHINAKIPNTFQLSLHIAARSDPFKASISSYLSLALDPPKASHISLRMTSRAVGGPTVPFMKCFMTSWSSSSSPLPLLLPLQPFRTSRCSWNPTATQSQGSAFPASVALDRPRYIVIVVTVSPYLHYFLHRVCCYAKLHYVLAHSFPVHHLEPMRAGLHLVHSCRRSLKTVTGHKVIV